jgi:WD40 repeat protein
VRGCRQTLQQSCLTHLTASKMYSSPPFDLKSLRDQPEVLDEFSGPFTACVNSVAFSRNGTHIVSGSRDSTIIVWDVETGVVISGPFTGHTESINSVAFSPNGKHISSSQS